MKHLYLALTSLVFKSHMLVLSYHISILHDHTWYFCYAIASRNIFLFITLYSWEGFYWFQITYLATIVWELYPSVKGRRGSVLFCDHMVSVTTPHDCCWYESSRGLHVNRWVGPCANKTLSWAVKLKFQIIPCVTKYYSTLASFLTLNHQSHSSLAGLTQIGIGQGMDWGTVRELCGKLWFVNTVMCWDNATCAAFVSSAIFTLERCLYQPFGRQQDWSLPRWWHFVLLCFLFGGYTHLYQDLSLTLYSRITPSGDREKMVTFWTGRAHWFWIFDLPPLPSLAVTVKSYLLRSVKAEGNPVVAEPSLFQY